MTTSRVVSEEKTPTSLASEQKSTESSLEGIFTKYVKGLKFSPEDELLSELKELVKKEESKETLVKFFGKLTDANWFNLVSQVLSEFENCYKSGNIIEEKLRKIDKAAVVLPLQGGGVLLDFGGRDLKEDLLSKDESTKKLIEYVNLLVKIGTNIPEHLSINKDFVVAYLIMLLDRSGLRNRNVRIELSHALLEFGDALPKDLCRHIVSALINQILFLSDIDYFLGVLQPFYKKEFLKLLSTKEIDIIVDVALLFAKSGIVNFLLADLILKAVHEVSELVSQDAKEKIIKTLVDINHFAGRYEYDKLLKLWCQSEVKSDATKSFNAFVDILKTELAKKPGKKESFLSIFGCTESHRVASDKSALLNELNTLNVTDLNATKDRLVYVINEYDLALKSTESLKHYWDRIELTGRQGMTREDLDEILFLKEAKQIRFTH